MRRPLASWIILIGFLAVAIMQLQAVEEPAYMPYRDEVHNRPSGVLAFIGPHVAPPPLEYRRRSRITRMRQNGQTRADLLRIDRELADMADRQHYTGWWVDDQGQPDVVFTCHALRQFLLHGFDQERPTRWRRHVRKGLNALLKCYGYSPESGKSPKAVAALMREVWEMNRDPRARGYVKY